VSRILQCAKVAIYGYGCAEQGANAPVLVSCGVACLTHNLIKVPTKHAARNLVPLAHAALQEIVEAATQGTLAALLITAEHEGQTLHMKCLSDLLRHHLLTELRQMACARFEERFHWSTQPSSGAY